MQLGLQKKESGGFGYEMIDNKLKNNVKGFRLRANWDNMDAIYLERRPFSVIVGVYWVFEPKTISSSTRRIFETDPNNTRQAITYVPIFEEEVDLVERGGYSRDVVVSSTVPTREGLTFGNRIIVWFRDQTFFEQPVLGSQNRINVDYHFPKWRFKLTTQGTQNNLEVIELVQVRK